MPEKKAVPHRLPKIGDEVLYVLEHGPKKGEARPAKVVQVWGDNGTANLQVFIDGSNDGYGGPSGLVWKTSIPYADCLEPLVEGSWHFPGI